MFHRQSRLLFLVVAVVLGGASVASAEKAGAIAWRSDVDRAWKASKQQNRPLLLFVTLDGCGYCTKMKQHTYRDPAVVKDVCMITLFIPFFPIRFKV